jgi:hypothetical protein
MALLLISCRVGPFLRALGEADEIGDRVGRLLLKELAGNAPHGRIHQNAGAVRVNHRGRGSLRGIGNILRGLG